MNAAALAVSTIEPAARGNICLRDATAGDAPAIHALVVAHLAEGHLLPRQLDEIAARAHRFIIATRHDRVVACAELAPLSRHVGEVRSLVVSGDARRLGIGSALLGELVDRARAGGFTKLCAFTHAPDRFVRAGFSIVPHVWLPEKIVTDCHACALFRRCGQYAVVRTLGDAGHGGKWGRRSFVEDTPEPDTRCRSVLYK